MQTERKQQLTFRTIAESAQKEAPVNKVLPGAFDYCLLTYTFRITPIILFLLFPIVALAQESNNSYFRQPPSGKIPVLFGPEIISNELENRDMAISPAGDELFYTVQHRGVTFASLMYSKKENDKWTKPEVASFSGLYNDIEPAFSPDGGKLYFASSRPLNGESAKDFDIWYVTKEKGVWSKPQNPGNPVNTEKNEFYPSVAKSGNIYFTREMVGVGEDIVVSSRNTTGYNAAVSLPASINSLGGEFNAFVDPDELYIIFTGDKRNGNYGTADLFISRKNLQGEWTEAVNLGEKINGPGITYCPYVSPDKKYFFFTSNRGVDKTPSPANQNILNGSDNIYWMNAKEALGIE